VISSSEFKVKEGGIRLDAAILREFPTTTRAFAREAVERGDVQVNDRPAAKGLKLRGGETVFVRELMEASDNRVKPSGDCPPAIFEDASLLAFDKPAGQPVQPLSCRETGTLMNAVVTRYPECREVGDSPLMAGALHRIDADTSGLVLVARTAAAFEDLRAQFSAQTVKKTYLALVEGAVAVGGTLENDLVHMPGLGYCKMVEISRARLSAAEREALAGKALHAVTAYRPLGLVRAGNEERTLLEVTIYTGVTHQIRAQLALAGLHIVNDRLYGGFAVEGMAGHCLHAWTAAFRHPVSGDPCELRTRLPAWAASLAS